MKIKNILPKALVATVLLGSLASPSFAGNVNINSGFYRSSRTRQAYINLSNEQRLELDAMNKNNNGWLTIKEVKDYGSHSLPVVKGQSYLYPFMDDRNNNGMVGENESQASKNSTTTENTDHENKEEILEEESLGEDQNSNQEREENPIASQIPSDYLDKLEESLKNAKRTIAGAEILTDSMPNFGEKYGHELARLIDNQKKIISKAEALLKANGR